MSQQRPHAHAFMPGGFGEVVPSPLLLASTIGNDRASFLE
jgi:hypothetical protein